MRSGSGLTGYSGACTPRLTERMTCSRGITARFASRCTADEVSSDDAADGGGGGEGGRGMVS